MCLTKGMPSSSASTFAFDSRTPARIATRSPSGRMCVPGGHSRGRAAASRAATAAATSSLRSRRYAGRVACDGPFEYIPDGDGVSAGLGRSVRFGVDAAARALRARMFSAVAGRDGADVGRGGTGGFVLMRCACFSASAASGARVEIGGGCAHATFASSPRGGFPAWKFFGAAGNDAFGGADGGRASSSTTRERTAAYLDDVRGGVYGSSAFAASSSFFPLFARDSSLMICRLSFEWSRGVSPAFRCASRMPSVGDSSADIAALLWWCTAAPSFLTGMATVGTKSRWWATCRIPGSLLSRAHFGAARAHRADFADAAAAPHAARPPHAAGLLLATSEFMRRARRNFLCFAAICISALAEDDVEEENRVLKLRLQALQQELAKEGDEMQYSYLVVKGMIADAESVYMETMDIDEAKRYCNSNPECKGFSFEGPETRPEDEVTVMFKGGNKVNHDALWVSYVKESSLFGALNAATGSDDTSNPRIISQSITFNSIALAFACTLAGVVACQRRRRRRPSRELQLPT